MLSQPQKLTFQDWLKNEIAENPYWFQKIKLAPGIETPGWSTPETEKLPYFCLPDDMTGMRVLDIGCSEGFFSFEAEKRGADEVIAIDSSPDSIQRFNVCRAALKSKAKPYLLTVYDLNPKIHGTFDLVMFFGVLYHLRHPILALERVLSVCSNTMLFQSAGIDEDFNGRAMAEFHPFGKMSGTKENPLFDHTVFWMPNPACIKAMIEHVGFKNVELKNKKAGFVFGAKAAVQSKGLTPDPLTVPGA